MKGHGLYHYYQNPGTITTSYRRGAWEVYCTMNRRLHDKFDAVKDYDFSLQLKLHMIYYACNCIGQAISLSKEEAITDIRKILNSQELSSAFQDFPIPHVSWKLKIQLWLMKYRMAALLCRLKK